jgi:hypothetical protein
MDSSEDKYLSELRQQISEGIERARHSVENAKVAFLTRRLSADQSSTSDDQSQAKEVA